MSDSETSRADADQLRRQAEAQWLAQPGDARLLPTDENVARLVQELEVHEIELELQNEELCQQRARLEESLDKYTDLYDFAPVAYFTLTGNGQIQELNLTAATLLGIPRKNLVHRRFGLFVTDEARPDFNRFLAQAISGDSRISSVVAVAGSNGVTRYLQVEGVAVDTVEGRLCRIAATDVTARKQAEDRVRQSEAQYRMLAETMQDVVWIFDTAKARLRYISPSVFDLVGYTVEELMASCLTAGPAQGVFAANIVTIQERVADFHAARVRTSGYFTDELQQLRKDGTPIWMEVTSTYYAADSGQVEVRGVARDVTERRQAQDALRAIREGLERRVVERTAELVRSRDELALTNVALSRALRLKDEFLATMSHELRTPLSGILGSTELLSMGVYGTLSDRAQHALENIDTSARHLLELINDILDVEKIEAGKLDLDLEPVDLNSLVLASLSMVQEFAQSKHLQVDYRIEPADLELQADPQRLTQILVNLLSNAVKFTPEGRKIGLDIVGNVATQVVQFVVWDEGIGIAPEDMSRLFTPFVQLDASLARRHEGTGLGLSLALRLAELHGGGIAVASVPGVGSQFTVTLPWRASDTTPVAFLAAPDRMTPVLVDRGDALLLLVEDNETSYEMLADYLMAKGLRVLHAWNGAEAVEMARRHRPDLIIMDVQMAGMDGITATMEIRKFPEPRLAAVPILGLTALAMPGDRERCLAAGMDYYLSKPVSLVMLMSIIRDLLSASAIARQAPM